MKKERLNQIVNSFSKINPILVLGDVGVDKYIQGTVSRISPEAPVPILHVSHEEYKLGMAANVAYNIKSLGGSPVVFCGIGSDYNGDQIIKKLNEYKITHEVIKTDRPTIRKERIVSGNHQICRIDYEEIGSSIFNPSSSKFTRHLTGKKTPSAVIIEDYAKGFFDDNTLKSVIESCKQNNILVAVDPNKKTNPIAYSGVDVIKPNEGEAEFIMTQLGHPKEKDPKHIAKIISTELEIPYVVLTLGGRGMAVYSQDSYTMIPTVAQTVFDVSGAGDTTISTLVMAISSGADLKEAAHIANLTAGIVVGKVGTAITNIPEILNFGLLYG